MTTNRKKLLGYTSLALCVVLTFAPVLSAGPKTISVDEVRKGMKGYGLTVFEGTKPVRFGVEVVSVVPKFFLNQDIILIRTDHPVTDKAGIIGGMSGSPIYIEGKLAGALAYGWRFNKEPLAGVTPIGNMFDLLKRKLRQIGMLGPFKALARLDRSAPKNKIVVSGRRPAPRWAPGGKLPAPLGELQQVRTPITLGGFGNAASNFLQESFAGEGVDFVQGGGAGVSPTDGPRTFELGSPIGVQLIRGDMAATAIGTVTTIDGNNVLGFGHPMFNMGESYLPVTTAQIHTVIVSLARSNKMGSPLHVAGSLVQDRKAAIMARTDKSAPMIPMTAQVLDELAGINYRYQVEVASQRQLSARLVQAALSNMVIDSLTDATNVTAEIEGTIKVAGHAPVTLRDAGISRQGLTTLAAFARPVQFVGQVLGNPYEDAVVEQVDFKIRLNYGLDVKTIVGAYLTAQAPAPGDKVNLNVRLQKYGGAQEIISVPIQIPEGLADKKITIDVGGGDFLSPPVPQPENLADMIANAQRTYPPRSLVIGINVPSSGLSLRGEVLEDLPSSALDALRPSTGADQMALHTTALRRVIPTEQLIHGKYQFTVEIDERSAP